MARDDKNVVDFPNIDEERARRLKVEVERLSRLSYTEWAYYVSLPGYSEKYGVDAGMLTKLVQAEVSKAEKKEREEKAEEQRREQRAERQHERRQREQRREQKEADKEAQKRQREREKEFAAILKLPSAEHESRLAALAKRRGEDLDLLREEFSMLVAAEETSGGTDSIEPWPEPVDLNVLLTETTAQVRRYVVIHDDAAVLAITLWIAFAWVHEIAVHSPILRITSGDADTGKTTLCGVLRYLTPRAYAAAEPTGPSLYRFVDQVHPTLIIDDADNLFLRKPDLVHIINVSWTRDSAKIPRQVHNSTYWFDAFCPKIFAGIGLALKPATLTRCIDVRMLPKLRDEKVADFEHVDDDTFVTLRRKWARFAADSVAALKDAAPAMSDFNNRIKMNWKLQFATADLAGGKWPKAVRAAAVKLTRERDEPSQGKRLLRAFQVLSAQHGPLLTSKQVERSLPAIDEEWGDYKGRGRAINHWELAVLLRPYGIRPKVIHPRGRPGDRGYNTSWPEFATAFKHYLPETLARGRTVVRPRRKQRR
jgi:putative DNA primase/helicase